MEVLEGREIKLFNMIKGLIKYFDLDMQIKGEEVRFVKKGQTTCGPATRDEMGLSTDSVKMLLKNIAKLNISRYVTESEITKAEEELNRKLEKIIL